ncbi:unnamed protein product, partial [Medioppia subpectinata]
MNELTIITSNDIEMESDNSVSVMSFEEFREVLQPMASNNNTITPIGNNNGQRQVSHNSFYHNTFDELNLIRRGAFGEVFRVRHKWDGIVYAIKKVEFPADESDRRQQRVLKEAQSLAKLSSQYVVQYHNSWPEDNVLYIQMEYCPQSLRKLLADKALAFGRQSAAELMKAFEYFISCEIFKELLECVEYIHGLDPLLIHRDIKPDNILIDPKFRSNRCVKLCDFGLATVHDPNLHSDSHCHTSGAGTPEYMAPEVFSGRYNHKSDIYSVGLIGKELFGIDFNVSQSFEANELVVKACILCMSQTLVNMMAIVWRQRPECRQVLAKHNEWSIDNNKSNVLFVINNMVYGFGHNGNGCLGLGHNRPAPQPQEIPELRNQSIQYFVNGYNFMLAVNAVNNVFSWGVQLAQGQTVYLRPQLIQHFSGKNIVQISCDYSHSLALTGDGRVYAWGNNYYGQIGCGDGIGFTNTPIEMTFGFNCKIQSVYCYNDSSFAITSDGRVFSWGENSYHRLGHNITEDKFREVLQPMASNSDTITPMGSNNGQSQVSQNNLYHNTFNELGQIGKGGFGTVFKVRHKLVGIVYAVKKVTYPAEGSDGRQQRVLKEAQSLADLSSQYVVQYYNSWLDNNVLYIQMEYCPQSLRKLLADKGLAFGRQSKAEPMNAFEYFISCEIFKELLECVEYIHGLNPPLIHRDVKPDNILIDTKFGSNRCVKLCDFGLATVHDPNRHTDSRYHTPGAGTPAYMAPEVFSGRYNHKSDIYSVGVIGKELFGIDFNVSQSFEANELVVKSCILCMPQTLEDMMITGRRWKDRTDCRQVLAKQNEWSIDKSVVT